MELKELRARERNIKKCEKILNDNRPNKILLAVNETTNESVVIRYSSFFAYLKQIDRNFPDEKIISTCFDITNTMRTELKISIENGESTKVLNITFLFINLM